MDSDGLEVGYARCVRRVCASLSRDLGNQCELYMHFEEVRQRAMCVHQTGASASTSKRLDHLESGLAINLAAHVSSIIPSCCSVRILFLPSLTSSPSLVVHSCDTLLQLLDLPIFAVPHDCSGIVELLRECVVECVDGSEHDPLASC